MKLLIASDYYYPHWTGLVSSMLNLVTALTSRFDITVLTVRHSTDLPVEEEVRGARVLRAMPLFAVSRAQYSLQSVFWFWREARHHDVVLLNSPCSNILLYALITKLFGKRLVIFHQGDLILTEGIQNRLIEGVYYLSTVIAMSLADEVSTYTQDYANQSSVLRHFLYKCTPMLMPVVLPTPAPEGDPVLAPLQELHDNGKLLLGFAGRFVEEKGFDILFAAVPTVLEALPNVHFVFAGETEIPYDPFYSDHAPTLARMERHVTLLGLLDPAQIARFYATIDALILPSRSDCFALVQAEAAVSGAPVVAANIPGAREMVRQTGFGLLFATEDATDLARQIVALVENRAEIKQNYLRVLEFFDTEAIVQHAAQVVSGTAASSIESAHPLATSQSTESITTPHSHSTPPAHSTPRSRSTTWTATGSE